MDVFHIVGSTIKQHFIPLPCSLFNYIYFAISPLCINFARRTMKYEKITSWLENLERKESLSY